ncbi:NAD(P)/FAD-dependent oxidoreductase [Streptomyces beihaiensis]|uniref:FAD-dependent oxidoreductase n=1 Tax=Streptomyces beihaiensis TaxID=2984495 RepID=A0ABT3TTS6_9ACTN|nr:FAD-dependent oxidoreductase [Streptomyces beihaiensis]MCX3059428.1 FAD-dependent oxidoreductase [Streptomyces beihaiensis]
MKHITVVGASLAGLSTVRSLRAEGYDGAVTVVGEERHAPYDRPPLSKEFLLGDVDAAALALGDADEDEALAADWVLGERAVGLDTADRSLTLASGRRLRTDGVVIATGASPRALPGAEHLTGIHTLRTLDDAQALRDALRGGFAPRVVVIGAGFIGAEVASTARRLGADVTVVEAAETPLERQLGREMAEIVASLHADNGVRLLRGTGVAGFTGDSAVTGVRLADGRLLPADVVVVGVGVRPTTDWLAGTGVRVDDGVVCDAGCATDVPGVVAVGDVARCPHPFTGRHARIEHWSNATDQARTAARTLLTGAPAVPPATAPYFWSDQYGVRIQMAGHVPAGAVPEIVEGDVEERSFVAVYRYGEAASPVAALALNRAKLFNRLRRTLAPATTTAVA